MEPSIHADMRFRPYGPDIVAESIDGEVIIINLNSGAYYSSTGTGERVWRAYSDGLSLGEVVASFCSEYGADQQFVQQSVVAFTEELCNEGLLAEGSGVGGDVQVETRDNVSQQFEPPVLHKYTDMQELLLLDPIHDIDPSMGWPVVKPTE